MGSTASDSANSGSSGTSKSSKSSFECDIQHLCNRDKLPAMFPARNWKIYTHKASIISGAIPLYNHERLILEHEKYLLCVELTNTPGTGISGAVGADWSIVTSLIDEYKDRSRSEWKNIGTSNFSLEHLIQYVANVMDKTGGYNVLTQNCQTFVARLAEELGKNVGTFKLNDGTVAVAGGVSSAIGSGIYAGTPSGIGSGVAIFASAASK